MAKTLKSEYSEPITLEELYRIHEKYGFSFEINNGEITAVYIE